MYKFSASARQTIDMLAVDNIYLGKTGLALLEAVGNGELSTAEAKEQVRARARAYAAALGIKAGMVNRVR